MSNTLYNLIGWYIEERDKYGAKNVKIRRHGNVMEK
jgi:hypothetical protein